MMAKTRNAGIFLPHPTASDCTAETVRICREAGEAAGGTMGSSIVRFSIVNGSLTL